MGEQCDESDTPGICTAISLLTAFVEATDEDKPEWDGELFFQLLDDLKHRPWKSAEATLIGLVSIVDGFVSSAVQTTAEKLEIVQGMAHSLYAEDEETVEET